MTDDVTVHHGDALDVLAGMPDASVDAVVTDPPYGLEFMGKDWDGADGFRRSLNPADAGRESVFGRTSRTSPEYRTASKAQASRRQEGGIPQATGPSFLGGLNPKCLTCNRWQRGSNPCHCEAPEWTQERLVRLHSFQEWCEAWAVECLRLLKPGGHLLAFGGTRTFHRLACAIEDAGFEIRDTISWLYGSGFPKSLDVSKAIDRAAGAKREVVAMRAAEGGNNFDAFRAGEDREDRPPSHQAKIMPVTAPATDDARRWQGWGTALKPAWEPVIVARKPLAGTVAGNVLAHGTGALNIDGCRVGTDDDTARKPAPVRDTSAPFGRGMEMGGNGSPLGRWPANVVLDEDAAAQLDRQSGTLTSGKMQPTHTIAQRNTYGQNVAGGYTTMETYGDSGGASRFYYTAKAAPDERPRVNGVSHPTIKPLELMRWLVRLVTPPGGIVLDPFAGSGTTGEACIIEGFRAVLIEREADYLPLIEARLSKPIQPTLGGTA